jgi:hypothetical protein
MGGEVKKSTPVWYRTLGFHALRVLPIAAGAGVLFWFGFYWQGALGVLFFLLELIVPLMEVSFNPSAIWNRMREVGWIAGASDRNINVEVIPMCDQVRRVWDLSLFLSLSAFFLSLSLSPYSQYTHAVLLNYSSRVFPPNPTTY